MSFYGWSFFVPQGGYECLGITARSIQDALAGYTVPIKMSGI